MPEIHDPGPVYERVDQAGQVVERVQPIAGDHEDTRLGLLALEGQGGWRVAGAETSTPQPPRQRPARPTRARKETEHGPHRPDPHHSH